MEYLVILNIAVLAFVFKEVMNLKIAIRKSSTGSLKKTKGWIDDELKRRNEL